MMVASTGLRSQGVLCGPGAPPPAEDGQAQDGKQGARPDGDGH